MRVSIPFKWESALQVACSSATRDLRIKFPFPSNRKVCSKRPHFNPMGSWLQKPKTKRELRGAFFLPKFCPKIPQTCVYTEPYAIFYQKRPEPIHCLRSGTIYAVFVSDRHIAFGFYKYSLNSQECQISFPVSFCICRSMNKRGRNEYLCSSIFFNP